MADAICDEEQFELGLNNFLRWLEVLTMEPIELCDTWGNYNVAWELVSDLNADGSFVVAAKHGHLTERQKQEVRAFLNSLALVPKSLLVSATTAAANQEAMSHSCWVRYREDARALLTVLESAAERNRAYFWRQQE